MPSTHKGQVQLEKLIFTMNWEDPLVDEQALRIKAGDTVFTITSGGCNTLGFLRFNPKAIYCVDINPAQTFLMELKQSAFRNLDHGGILSFFGLTNHISRKKTFQQLSNDLSPDARLFWKNNMGVIENGILMHGRFERFVKIAGRLMRLIQGSGKTKHIFQLDTLQQQKQFYDQQWNNARWQWIFKAMFNKHSLAKKGLNADYFHFDDGSASFSESFLRRAGHALCDLPVRSNYFMALYLLGQYLNQDDIPPYLKYEHFRVIKSNIDLIKPVTADSKYWLMQQPDNCFDGMALSNICELMDDVDTNKLFQEVLRTSKPLARLVFRNLMIPREVPDKLRSSILKNEAFSKELQYSDRSFVYGKVASYTIVKPDGGQTK
jgi:S-adenosylmethionine-diacylglycerol 3-amino-3-carboxypropyl transferase